MTALIGGLCVGVLWGVWATRQLLRRKREIRDVIERNRIRNANLEVILNGQNNGKEQTNEGQAEKTGETSDN